MKIISKTFYIYFFIILLLFYNYSYAELIEIDERNLSLYDFSEFVTKSINAAKILADEKIIEDYWYDGNKYNIAEYITRWELAKIVLKLSKKEINNTCLNYYKDLNKNDWACKYAETGVTYGFFSLNDNFRPYDNVTKIEALKMIMQARWIKKTNNSDWKLAYMEAWVLSSILDYEFTDYNWYISRWHVFMLAANKIIELQKYNSEYFDISINIPSTRKEVILSDWSYKKLDNNSIKSYTTITSPDWDEKLTFINKPIDIKNNNCIEKLTNINNITTVTYTKCENAQDDQIPWKYNYQFLDKDLIIVANKESKNTIKIITSVK